MTLPIDRSDTACAAGLHLWRDPEDAARCCAGWTPVRIPFTYLGRLDDWVSSEIVPSPCEPCWCRTLVPSAFTELIRELRVREPHVFRSSTGPLAPWLRLPV